MSFSGSDHNGHVQHRRLIAPPEVTNSIYNEAEAIPVARVLGGHNNITADLASHNNITADLASKSSAGSVAAAKVDEAIVDKLIPADFQQQSGQSMNVPEMLTRVFRSERYTTFVLIVIMGNTATVCMIGSLKIERAANALTTAEYWFSVFFLCDFIAQVGCDGSLAKFFSHPEHNFDFLVQLFTTSALIAQAAGAPREYTSVLRSIAILRVIRASKYFFLRPIWLMLIKMTESAQEVSNVILFIAAIMTIYTIMGMSLFGNQLDDPRANYDDFGRGFLTLFQIFTGDGWGGTMFAGMFTACHPLDDMAVNGTGPDDQSGMKIVYQGQAMFCETGKATFIAVYYVSFLFIGQYIFVTIFLALILESFAVDDFMTIERPIQYDEFELLPWDDALELVAEWQKLPVKSVSQEVMVEAFQHLRAAKYGGRVPREPLIDYIKKYHPLKMWRFAKRCKIDFVRYHLRTDLLCFFGECGGWCVPWPGDPDWEAYIKRQEIIIVEISPAEKEAALVRDLVPTLRDWMDQFTKLGMIGLIHTAAAKLELQRFLDVRLRNSPPEVLIQIMRDITVYERLSIDPVMLYPADPKLNPYMVVDKAVVVTDSMQAAFLNSMEAGKDDPEAAKQNAARLKAQNAMDEDLDDLKLNCAGLLRLFLRYYSRFFLWLAQSPGFDSVVYGTILVSSIFIAADSPANEIEPFFPRNVLILGAWVFNVIFAAEFLSKVAAFGFFKAKSKRVKAYWSDNWNRMDLFVLLLSTFDLISTVMALDRFVGQTAVRGLRVMRALRPLRMMNRNQGMKTIITALIGSAKPIAYATLFLVLTMIVWGVIGVAMFKDSFSYCVDPSLDGTLGEGYAECLNFFMRDSSVGYVAPRAWLTPTWAMDTFPLAILTLMRVVALNWVDVWNSTQDKVGPNIQPVTNINSWAGSIYLITFIFFGAFFALNLFVGFIVDGFYTAQGVDSKFDDIQYATIQKMIHQKWPKERLMPPRNAFSQTLRRITSSQRFHFLSATFLIVNVVCMTMQHKGQDSLFSNFLDVQNNLFFGLMCFESFLVLLGWGPKIFIKDEGNQFDIFLIAMTSLCLIFDDALRSMSQGIRVLRLMRLVRRMQKNKLIKAVFETVTLSIPQVGNILVVLLLAMSVFSVLGVTVFGTVKPGLRISKTGNFDSFPNALLTLWQVLFGDDWMYMMDDCMVSEPSCTGQFEGLSYGDCGSMISPIFFVTFKVIGQWTMINLFIGMIINNFSFCSNRENEGALTDADIDYICDHWIEKFDEKGSSFIPLEKVYQLMLVIGPPLGFDKEGPRVMSRYLRAREDLKLVIEEDEADNSLLGQQQSETIDVGNDTFDFAGPKQQNKNVLHGPVTRLFLRLRAKEDKIRKVLKIQYDQLKSEWENAIKAEAEIVASKARKAEAQREERERRAASNENGHEVDEVAGHGAGVNDGIDVAADEPSGSFVDSESGKMKKKKKKKKSCKKSEGGAQEEGGDEVAAVSGSGFGNHGWVGVQLEQEFSEASSDSDFTGGTSLWVSGESMGHKGGGKPSKKTKKVAASGPKKGYTVKVDETTGEFVKASGIKNIGAKKKGKKHDSHDDDDDDDLNRSSSLKGKGKEKNKLVEPPKRPAVTWELLRASFWRWLVGLLLNQRDMLARPPGSVKYDEVINALMYWNEESARIPKKILDKRKATDAKIVLDCAAQVVQAWVRGRFFRKGWRPKTSKTAKTANTLGSSAGSRRQSAIEMEIATHSLSMGSVSAFDDGDEACSVSPEDGAGTLDRRESMESQGGGLTETAWQLLETGWQLRKIVDKGLMSLDELASIALDLGLPLPDGDNPVFDLDDEFMAELLMHPHVSSAVGMLDMSPPEIHARKQVANLFPSPSSYRPHPLGLMLLTLRFASLPPNPKTVNPKSMEFASTVHLFLNLQHLRTLTYFISQILRLVAAGQSVMVELVAESHGLDIYVTGGIADMSGKMAMFLLRDDRIQRAVEDLEAPPDEEGEEEAAARAAAAKLEMEQKLQAEAEKADEERQELSFVLEETKKRCSKLEEDFVLMQRRADAERELTMQQISAEMERLEEEVKASCDVARAKTASAAVGRRGSMWGNAGQVTAESGVILLPGEVPESPVRGSANSSVKDLQSDLRTEQQLGVSNLLSLEASSGCRPVNSLAAMRQAATERRLTAAPPAPLKRDDSDLAKKISQDPKKIHEQMAGMRVEIEQLQKELVRCKTAEARSSLSPEELAMQREIAERAKQKRAKTFNESASQSAVGALGIGGEQKVKKGGFGIYGAGRAKISPSWL